MVLNKTGSPLTWTELPDRQLQGFFKPPVTWNWKLFLYDPLLSWINESIRKSGMSSIDSGVFAAEQNR
jgi:hypothetical protein